VDPSGGYIQHALVREWLSGTRLGFGAEVKLVHALRNVSTRSSGGVEEDKPPKKKKKNAKLYTYIEVGGAASLVCMQYGRSTHGVFSEMPLSKLQRG
jgi:hypothetical protein